MKSNFFVLNLIGINNFTNSMFKILSSLIFFHKVVANFSKEFYHWLAFGHNEAQLRAKRSSSLTTKI